MLTSTSPPAPHVQYHPCASLVPKCLNSLHCLTLHPQLSHLLPFCYVLFFLMFVTIFLWQLPNFFCAITRSFFPMSRASNTSSTISSKHLRHLTPSTFTTLLLPSFFYHNVTPLNSVLSSCQTSPPRSLVNTALTHLTMTSLVCMICFSLRQNEVTIRPPHSKITHSSHHLVIKRNILLIFTHLHHLIIHLLNPQTAS